MKIGVGYIRMSTDKQQESPKVQKDIIQEYAAANDIKIIKWYEDLGISGGSLKNREGMMELIFDAEKKLFDVIIAFKLDRIFRNIEEQSVILNKFDNLGIKFLGIKDPEGEGASGRLIRNVLGAINQFERELTGERIFYSNRHRAKNGLWAGGVLPLGYDLNSETKTLVINKDEAKLVNLIKELYFKHRSCYKVGKTLNSMGYVSKQGRKFSGVAISGILRNPTYCGKIRWNKKGETKGKMEIFEGQHEAIWSESEYKNIQQILDNNINNEYGNKRAHLLSGLLVCGDCGYKIKARYGRKSKLYYRCMTSSEFGKDFCKNDSSISERLIHPLVLNTLRKNIANVNFNKRLDKPSSKFNETDIDREIERLEGLIEKYKNLYLMDIIKEEDLKYNIDNLKIQINSLKKSNISNKIDPFLLNLIVNFDYLFEKADDREKKDIVRSLIDKIIFVSKLDFIIKYKNFNIPGWNTQDEIHITTDKKSISKKELERILEMYKG